MPDLTFVSALVETIYGFSPVEIEAIQRYSFDWRGIFYLREQNDQRWVLRLLKHPNAANDFHITATFLDWLHQQRYPVPRVRRTREQQFIGIRDDWVLLLLSFIEGEVITPAPANLRLLSARLGQLHILNHLSAPATRLSRTHPESIATRTIPQLQVGSQSVPATYAPLFNYLSASMSAILQMEDMPLGITHGDCWYLNAIKTDGQRVELIDWDNVGIGFPILDLGYLLLSSHFRVDNPFSIKSDQDKIQAILEGYQGYYRLSSQEMYSLLQAVHFPLAYHLGMYYENNAPLREDDLFLKKTQQRFNEATVIAQMAAMYAQET